MKKLLLILSLIFLTSPALADHVILADMVVTCGNIVDAIGYVYIIKNESESPAVGKLTTRNMDIAAQNNDCELHPKFTIYAEFEEYVCEFTVIHENFTLLDNKTEWNKRFIIVKGTIFRTADKRPLECISLRQLN